MSVQGSTSNLTSKFSRTSLKKATGKISATNVPNREEELQKATNKRFNSDSWRKVSQNYRAFPTAPPDGSNVSRGNSFSNTQVLYTMSSLTNDEAFLHSKGQTTSAARSRVLEERRLTRSASYVGGRPIVPNGQPSTISTTGMKMPRPQTPFSRVDPSQRSEHSDLTPGTTVSSVSDGSTTRRRALDTRDDVDECHSVRGGDERISREAMVRPVPTTTATTTTATEPSRPSRRSTSVPSQRSVTSTSSKTNTPAVPRLNRTLSGRRLLQGPHMMNYPPHQQPQQRGGATKPLSSSKSVVSYQTAATTYPSIPQKKNFEGSMNQIRSFLSFFAKAFKIFHYLVLLPKITKTWFFPTKWTATGKTILITGASSGIGAELARQYASQGAKLALIARTEQDLLRIKEECGTLGSQKAIYYTADLSNPVSTKLVMRQTIKDFGHFDMVILNAGRNQGCYFEEIQDVSQIESMIKLNINGAITCLHYALPTIPKVKESRIVVMSHTTGWMGAPYQSIYSATKHALNGFSNSIRMELETTYGVDAPRVCLVTLPEISGTRGNQNRMDMGASRPPMQWYPWAGQPLSQAVYQVTLSIAAGKREHYDGRTMMTQFKLWRTLYAICPSWVDQWMMNYVEKTHYRPSSSGQHGHRDASDPTSMKSIASSAKRPTNRSWAA